jgi:hypothetical protein
MRKVILRLVFLLAVSFIGLAEANACECVEGGAVCQDYWKTSAVFVGTVIETKVVPYKSGDFEHTRVHVSFSIDEPFRGVEGAQVEVLTGMGGGDCGYRFSQSKQYLVYAHEYEGKLHTGICNRTREISSASDDLSYIRGLKNVNTGGLIYGEVHMAREDRRAVSRARIVIDGPDKKELTTDAKGSYRADRLQPGEYTIKIVMPERTTTPRPEEKVTLANGGCAVVSFWLENDGKLTGQITNPQGLPVSKAQLFLMDSERDKYMGHWDIQESDQEGKYGFNRIPPGRYVMAIRFDGLTSQNRPFPVIYYPAATDRTHARVISIGEGQSITNFNIEAPPLPAEYEVTGTVVWTNGQPATGARVGYMVHGDSIVYGATVDAVGKFHFKAYEGLKLTLRAHIGDGKGGNVYSEWANATAGPALTPIRLTLTRP